MRRLRALLATLALAIGLAGGAVAPLAAQAKDSGTNQQMYRCYNPNSGEHFYTASPGERDHIVSLGWRYEGVGWTAPGRSDTPVYRLYNPNAGDHHYTTSAAERDYLRGVGWSYEGVGWYSSDTKATPLYRQYNPNAVTGTHNYTTSRAENDHIVSLGWRAEGIGWYGVGGGPYKVRFVTETDQGRRVVSEQTLRAGQAIKVPADPTRDRYEFRGWGDGVTDGMACHGDATYEAVWAPTSVTPTSSDGYGTSLTYMDGTKSATGTVSVDGKSATVPSSQASGLKSGDIVVVNPTDPYEMAAIKVDSIEPSGGSSVVRGTKAKAIDYVKDLSIKSDPKESGDWMFVPESELEAADAPRTTARPSFGDTEASVTVDNGYTRTKTGIKATSTGAILTGEVVPKKGINRKVETKDVRKYLGLKDGESENLEVNASVTLNPKITTAITYDRAKGFTEFKTDFDIGADINAKMSNSKENEHTVYRLGVFYCANPEIPLYFSVYLTFQADGSVELKATPEESVSIALKDWRFEVKRKDSLGDPSITVKANARVGVMPSLAIGLPGLLVADIDLDGGAKGSATLTPHLNPTLTCLDLKAWFYLDLETAQQDGLEKDVLALHKELTGDEVPVKLELVNESNSPLKGSWHFENDKLVPECTWNGHSVQEAISKYRQILKDVPGQGAFLKGYTPSGEYWYALVKMSEGDVPTMLVAQNTTSGVMFVRLYHYNTQTKSVDVTTRDEPSSSFEDGLVMMGVRTSLSMEKDGNGLCFVTWSGGTGNGEVWRYTQDGDALKSEKQGEFNMWSGGGAPSAYIGETIQWLGIADTRALDSWPETVQSTGEGGFPAKGDTTTQSVDQAGSGSGSTYENGYFSVQAPDNWGSYVAGSNEDGTWYVMQTKALDGAVATYNCSFQPVIPAGMDPEAWHAAGSAGGGAIISIVDPSSGSSSSGDQTIGKTSSGLEIVVVTEAGAGFTDKCTITPK